MLDYEVSNVRGQFAWSLRSLATAQYTRVSGSLYPEAVREQLILLKGEKPSKS